MENYIIYLVHFSLGVILFFIINWIGKNSFSVGYMQISVFVKEDNAPAFNIVIRILSPIIYILIVSVIFYKLGLDSFVQNIYMVSVFYLGFRLVFNLITNRGLLINWGRQVFYWSSIIFLSIYVYKELIIVKKNLFPDISGWTNEIWIIVLIFVYSVFNRLRFSQKNTILRKNRYIINRYNKFNKNYGIIVDDNINNIKLKCVVYSIMIYEDFNRPKIVRFLENIVHLLSNKEHTLGLMQIKTNRLINDRKSVGFGVKKIVNKHLELVDDFNHNKEKRVKEREERKHQLYIEHGIKIPETSFQHDESDWEITRNLIKDYNPDDEYISEITELTTILQKMYYPDLQMQLYE